MILKMDLSGDKLVTIVKTHLKTDIKTLSEHASCGVSKIYENPQLHPIFHISDLALQPRVFFVLLCGTYPMLSRENVFRCLFAMVMICWLEGKSQPVDWLQEVGDDFPNRYWLEQRHGGIDIPRWDDRFNDESKRRFGLLADGSDKEDDSSDGVQQLKRLGNRKFKTQGWRRKRSH
uniref:Uncharacterized protein n=1 Tax=Strigamia maritima TaxID=126957 RepID=T1JLP6_STRMM